MGRNPFLKGHAMSKIGRDAGTGKFIPVAVAQRRPATAVVETIKRPSQPAAPTTPRKK